MKIRNSSFFERLRIFINGNIIFHLVLYVIIPAGVLLLLLYKNSLSLFSPYTVFLALLGVYALRDLPQFIFSIKEAYLHLRVLENGEVVLAKFLRSEATEKSFFKKSVVKRYFSFTDKYGKQQETLVEDQDGNLRIQYQTLERLVYIPDSVEKSVSFNKLPSFVCKRLDSTSTHNPSKARNFSFFETIGLLSSVHIIWLIIGILLIVASAFLTIDAIKSDIIPLYLSNNYTDGTFIGIKERRTMGKSPRTYYYHTYTYEVNGKSYKIGYEDDSSDSTKTKKITYLAEDPEISTVDPINSVLISAVIIIAFFGIGLSLLIFGIKNYRYNLSILENGEIALGKFLHSEVISEPGAKVTLVKLYFSFTDKHGNQQQTSVETKASDADKLQDEALEMLVYMPNSVEKSVFLDKVHSFVRKKLESEFAKLKSDV